MAISLVQYKRPHRIHVHCTADVRFTSVELPWYGKRAVALWHRYLLAPPQILRTQRSMKYECRNCSKSNVFRPPDAFIQFNIHISIYRYVRMYVPYNFFLSWGMERFVKSIFLLLSLCKTTFNLSVWRLYLIKRIPAFHCT